jgi:transposase
MGWVVAMLTPLSNKISLRSIPCGAVEQLMEIVDQTINRVMQTTGESVQVVSCYEAGYGSEPAGEPQGTSSQN